MYSFEYLKRLVFYQINFCRLKVLFQLYNTIAVQFKLIKLILSRHKRVKQFCVMVNLVAQLNLNLTVALLCVLIDLPHRLEITL
jgi:hypothetical protein